MKRISSVYTLFFLVITGCAGSGGDTQQSNPVVAVIGSERMTLREFEDAYAKNNGGWEKGVQSTQEERERFLNLFIKFKLKVREARARGLERDSTVRQELDNYGVSIATSYMLDKEIVEPNIRKLYERKKEELRASHILVRFPNSPPSPYDTLAAFQKAKEILAQVHALPFDSLVVLYSQDQSASTNRGDLGFFSVGRMVPEFENAAYGLQIGEYNRVPVRTQFGYHIIKLTDRRPASGSIRVSHILRRFSPTMEDTASVADSARIIYKLVSSGEMSFDSAATRFSQDPATAPKGGDFGFIERVRIPENIGQMFYGNPVGTIFEPMSFPYGYHIFKTTEIQPVPPFEETERELRTQYQNMRYPKDYAEFLHMLKKKLQLTLEIPTMYEFTHAFDTTKSPSRGGWSDTLRTELLPRVIMTLGAQQYTVQDLVEYIKTSEEFKNTLLNSSNIESIVERFTEIKILERESKSVAARHPEFEKMMREYEDGVLLFKIEQDEVWDKVDVSEPAFMNYYETHLGQYRLEDKVNLQEILLYNKPSADSVYQQFLAGEDFGELAKAHTIRPTMNEKLGIWGMQSPGKNDITKKAWELPVDSVSTPFHANEGWAIVKTLEKQHARVRRYDEVSTEVASAYRDFASQRREEMWVNELKAKYGVIITTKALSNAFRGSPRETR